MSVFIVEPMKAWTVDIEDTDYFPAAVDGNDYFGIRGRVTSDMSRECVDIWHKHCAVFCDSSTTDSLSYFDLYACRFSLEWSENQIAICFIKNSILPFERQFNKVILSQEEEQVKSQDGDFYVDERWEMWKKAGSKI